MATKIEQLSLSIRNAVMKLDQDQANKNVGQLIQEIESQKDQLIQELMRFKSEGGNIDEWNVVRVIYRVLQVLRRKRHFKLLREISIVYLDQIVGGDSPKIQLQLIQALIDQGFFLEAMDELLDLTDKHPINTWAGAEARGLIGRVHKQAYVNAWQRTGSARRSLGRAIRAYHEVYLANKSEYWWHGINAVACLARAERDKILQTLFQPGETVPDWRQLAREILDCVSKYEEDDIEYTWAMATATEACIALEWVQDALDWCDCYIMTENADVFELGSTERQLREVWELDTRDIPGAEVLNIIQGRLGRLGGEIQSLTQREIVYQAQYGDESAVSQRWLDRIQLRATSVAKIYKDTDDKVGGTGFLLKQKDLDDSTSERILLLTNHHVVNKDGSNGAIPLNKTVVQLSSYLPGRELLLRDVLWSDSELDATICTMEIPEAPAGARQIELGLPIGRRGDLCGHNKKPRMYVVGHPLGSGIHYTLYDNRLIDMDQCTVRYRSPTESGSSGSPVLTEDLDVVAIHHATRPGQSANQGVLLDCIREKFKNRGI